MPRTYNDYLLQKEGAGAQGFIQNVLNAQDSIATPASNGLTGAAWNSALIVRKSIENMGNRLIRTTLVIDLTGLDSIATANDVIGKSTSPAWLHQYKVDESGTCVQAFLHCLETPATGDADVDLFSATVNTYILDNLSTGLTGYVKLLDGATLAANDLLSFIVPPLDGAYIGLAAGTGVAGTYTAGICQIVFLGMK